MTPRHWFRGVAATAAAVVFAVAGGSAALADQLFDNVSASSPVDLTVGGPDGAAEFWVNATGSCDITVPTGNLVVNVVTSNSAVATVSPSQLTFTGCHQNQPVVITPVGVGKAQVTLTFVSEPTGSQIVYNTAVVPVEVTTEVTTPTTTTVSCPASVTYDGSPKAPCTATVTGSGGFSQSLSVGYTANTNVGTVTASAAYAGSSTRGASSGTASFQIAKASSTTTVTCPVSVVYTGTAQAPCSAAVTGAGALSQSLSPTYAGNTAVGTATASASYGGDANHNGSSDSETFDITKAGSTVTVTCGTGPFTYTGLEQAPCSATVTGAGGLDQSVPVTYENNTDAGTATATASFTGDASHGPSGDTETFVIGQANAVCTVTDYSGTYDANPHHVTGTCTGLGGADLTSGFDPGASFTNAGDHTATWTFEGGTNYADQNGTASVTIGKASSTTVVDCPASVTYDGSAQEPCTATVTGVGGLDESLTPTYADNTNAGTATASANFVGDANHTGSNGSDTFEIEKATSSTVVSCPDGPFVYTGSPITPACTASTTGAGGLSASPTVTFAGNTNAGTATASAAYAGDSNHEPSDGSTTFAIDKAPSAVTLICTSPVTYSGTALEPCSAKATGAGGLDEALQVTYGDNTDAGTATASASYAGDANHDGSSADTTFTIAKAPTSTAVTCPAGPYVYTGSAITPDCTATTTGAGGLSVHPAVTLSGNTNAGTATASASYAGGDNHQPSTGSTTFTIAKAPTTVLVTCAAGPFVYTGSPFTPCSATVTGAGGLSQSVSVVHSNNVGPGTATATATYAGDDNHLGSTGSATFTIDAWVLKGFHSPVDMNGVWNTVKGGSTVPLKFEVFAGATELTATNAVKGFAVQGIACPGANAAVDDIELTTTGGTTLRYDSTGGQFIQNWQTPKQAGACYKVTMTTQDGSSLSALFKLK